MPGGMGEVLRQFPLAKHTARGAIHFASTNARSHRRNRDLLCFKHRLVKPSRLHRRPSDMHSSRAIRTITGEYNTKITHHEPTPRNARSRGPAMHNRRAKAGSQYGREGHAFGPGTTSLVFHGGRGRELTHARPNLPACNPEEAGAKFNRSPNAPD